MCVCLVFVVCSLLVVDCWCMCVALLSVDVCLMCVVYCWLFADCSLWYDCCVLFLADGWWLLAGGCVLAAV